MGTNYYLIKEQKQTCVTCGHTPEQERIHIGKASFGWKFLFNGRDFKSMDEVIKSITATNAYILDEYGTHVPPAELLQTIYSKRYDKHHREDLEIHEDIYGFEFTLAEFC